jgi:chemotaxis family two-component system response regulator Rcp1
MLNAPQERSFELLLVQDNPEEMRSAQEILAQTNLPIRVRTAGFGETMDVLRQEGTFSDSPRPDLILLELSHQSGSAIELLTQIKLDQELQAIPVAVLGPPSEEAIDTSFESAADLYIAKPLDAQQLVITVNWVQGL